MKKLKSIIAAVLIAASMGAAASSISASTSFVSISEPSDGTLTLARTGVEGSLTLGYWAGTEWSLQGEYSIISGSSAGITITFADTVSVGIASSTEIVNGVELEMEVNFGKLSGAGITKDIPGSINFVEASAGIKLPITNRLSGKFGVEYGSIMNVSGTNPFAGLEFRLNDDIYVEVSHSFSEFGVTTLRLSYKF